MKVFVWSRIEQATDNYHSEGGVVVFAESEQQARELANAVEGCFIEADELPDEVRELFCDSTDPRVFIFPDAGCC